MAFSSLHGLFLAISLFLHSAFATQGLWASSFGVAGANQTFDYVIVGGGVAGLTLARRLADNYTVAVVEAGGLYQNTNGNLSVVPGNAIGNTFLTTDPAGPAQPLIDWRYITEPIPGIGNKSIHYARGKALGGSSSINGLAYHRATTGTYQKWADLVDDQSYQFPSLLKFFQKSVNFTAPNTQSRLQNGSIEFDDKAFNNSMGGSLQVGYPNWVDPPLTWLARGMQSIGLPTSKIGFNSGILSGQSGYVTSTVDNPGGAIRSSSQTAFFSEAYHSSNQTVFQTTLAKKVLFDDKKHATGVLVSSDGFDYMLSARNEVILAGGVFNSPQLLMLSGVGPKDTLDKFKIPVVNDLPGVGLNLWDQQGFAILHQVNVPTSAQLTTSMPYAADTAMQYATNATGPLSSVDGFVGFEKLPKESRANFSAQTNKDLEFFPEDWPEMEYLNAVTLFEKGANIFGVSGALVSPLSRGYVSLKSADPRDAPLIQPNWFSNPGDREIMVAAFKRVRAIWAGMSDVTIGPEITPGANVTSDDDIFAYIASGATPLYHASGTCAMGKAGVRNSVVDSQARVFGVTGLRVADGAALPFAVPGHNQATVYMLAEKIADSILNGGDKGKAPQSY